MTYATHTDHPLGGTFFWQRLSELKANLVVRFAQGRAHRTTINELSAMSDRDLTDLCIHRADIHALAEQAAYRA